MAHPRIAVPPVDVDEPPLPEPLSRLAQETRHLDRVLDQLETLAQDLHSISRATRAESIYTYLLVSFSLFVRDAEALLNALESRGRLVNGEATAVADMRVRLRKLPGIIEPVFAGLREIRGNGLPPNPERFAISVFLFTEFVRMDVQNGTWRLIELASRFLTEQEFAALSRDIAFRRRVPGA